VERAFDTLSTCDGRHEVIDAHTGRPVGVRDTLRSANGVAFRLNQAAADGPDALARALGCRPQRSKRR
jgi:hypothetical protein